MPQAIAKPRQQQQPVEQPEVWNFARDTNTKIIGFSGKIGAGKSVCAKYLHSLSFMFVLGLTKQAFVDEQGKLVVMNSEGVYQEFNLDDRSPETVEFLRGNVWPFIKKYSCADPLKQLCVNILGLDEKLVYGTQEDKNMLTHLKWEDMPTRAVEKVVKKKKTKDTEESEEAVYKTGYMTVREVTEYVGTELFRKIDNDCWASALVRNINQDKSEFAVVDDIRFENEVRLIQAAGGKVIRLTRTTEEAAANTHTSNVALDGFDGFDAAIDNQNLSIEDTFRELIRVLTDWEYFKVVNQ